MWRRLRRVGRPRTNQEAVAAMVKVILVLAEWPCGEIKSDRISAKISFVLE